MSERLDMSKKLEIPVGAAFEKRLAELVWENCPELAKSTAAGKMALALDVDTSHISDVVVSSLLSIAEEKVLPTVVEQFKSRSDEVVAKFQTEAEKLLKHTSELLDKSLTIKVNDKLDSLVAAQVKAEIVQILDRNLSGNFSSMVMEVARKAVESHVAHRLDRGSEAGVLARAEERIIGMENS